MGILERIAEIENEINRTQKNKGRRMFEACLIGPVSKSLKSNLSIDSDRTSLGSAQG